jgi:CelD/BcsL family acetyltransferase involved in cellulose biosynthesis
VKGVATRLIQRHQISPLRRSDGLTRRQGAKRPVVSKPAGAQRGQYDRRVPILSAHLEVSPISTKTFEALWPETQTALAWDCLFVLPRWLQPVVDHLDPPGDPQILTIRKQRQLIGIVPLAVTGDRATFLGSPQVCDYQDIVSAPGKEATVLLGVIDYLRQQGIHTLDLETLRPGAALFKGVGPLAQAGKLAAVQSPVAVTYEMPLPQSWEGYLNRLTGKQRHEVRRKVRRLEAVGPCTFRRARTGPGLQADIAAFLKLFGMNRRDKADFMDRSMSAFFEDLMNAMAGCGLLRLFFLEIAGAPAAAVLCFDYKGTRYLYNSAYNDHYNDLSVGILSKVFSIRSATEAGIGQYDFLKGAEPYKQRIGGREVQLHRCKIEW